MRHLVLSLPLLVLAGVTHADTPGYVCTFQGIVDKDINGNVLPPHIMTIRPNGEVAEVVETSFSAGSEHRYEVADTYDVYSNNEIGLILTRLRSGHSDDDTSITFLSVYTIIVDRATNRMTYGYIYDGLEKTSNTVGSCIES